MKEIGNYYLNEISAQYFNRNFGYIKENFDHNPFSEQDLAEQSPNPQIPLSAILEHLCHLNLLEKIQEPGHDTFYRLKELN